MLFLCFFPVFRLLEERISKYVNSFRIIIFIIHFVLRHFVMNIFIWTAIYRFLEVYLNEKNIQLSNLKKKYIVAIFLKTSVKSVKFKGQKISQEKLLLSYPTIPISRNEWNNSYPFCTSVLPWKQREIWFNAANSIGGNLTG